jgi:chemotaxis-related protein WspD
MGALPNVSSGRAKALDACWSRIGVDGDRSCPELVKAVHCRNCPVFAAAGQRLFDRETPPEYLEEWTHRVAEVDAAGAGEMASLLVFRLGGEWLALDVRWLMEVVEPRRVHRVPHRTDRLLLGLVNIRGELQLGVSLRELLGIDPVDEVDGGTAESRQRFLVADHGQSRWVFPVDEVEGVHAVPKDSMENLPHTVERSPRYYTQAVFSQGDRKIGVLSETRLFEALERVVR